jgi:hypothetical protein
MFSAFLRRGSPGRQENGTYIHTLGVPAEGSGSDPRSPPAEINRNSKTTDIFEIWEFSKFRYYMNLRNFQTNQTTIIYFAGGDSSGDSWKVCFKALSKAHSEVRGGNQAVPAIFLNCRRNFYSH